MNAIPLATDARSTDARPIDTRPIDARTSAVDQAIDRLLIRRLGRQPFGDTYRAMRAFTASRSDADSDELWLVEHAPVYTAGTAARAEHFPRSNEPESIHAGIPLERIDRGGQITYHGPGQAVIYTMIDLARRKLTVRGLVTILEQAVIDTLAAHAVVAVRRPKAPGVYVGDAKIAALGLRVSRGCSYHGLAINCEMDLRPYASIDPCGFPGLAVTQTNNLGIALEWEALGLICAERIVALTRLGTSLRP